MEEREYDIAVVGCGAAGATFARLIDPRCRVVVIDRKSGSGEGFQKPCGGLLAADAQKALSRFNLTLPKEILVDPQIFAVKTIDLNSGSIRHYQRFYINLDRHKFDLWLASLIPQTVDRIEGFCTGVERREQGFSLSVKNAAGEQLTIRAKYVVGADGSNSVVRKSLMPSSRCRQYVAIQQWFAETHETPFYSCIFDRETSPCCSWSISKDSHFIFGGAFEAKNCRKNFERQKQKLRAFGFQFGEPIKTEACMSLVRSPSPISAAG
jgi:flavin-dependent dehydrogenase